MHLRSLTILSLIPALLASQARAEVTDANSSGFTIHHVTRIAAPRHEAYSAATQDIGKWWSDEHTFSGIAANLSIDARPLGCFCEALGDHGGVVHMTVTFVNPGEMLRLTGGLGPLGLLGVNGNMTWEFADEGEGSVVTLSYAVGGYRAGGLDALAPAVDAVLVEQMTRLKAYVERQAGRH